MKASNLSSTVIVALAIATASCAGTNKNTQDSPDMSFFITSVGLGDGANLGGLPGADQHCTTLATSAGVGDKTWRAYLSTQASDGTAAIHARDRIGEGPWHNANGVLVVESLETLHGENALWTKETALDEKGNMVNGRGDSPNKHDILTGTQLDGSAFGSGEDKTCSNWTSNGDGSAQVGHHDRTGGGDNPTSWHSAHGSRGCSQANLQGTGGDGLFYCFAVK